MAPGKFKFYGAEKVRVIKAPIATATVIEAGDLVALSSGLIIKAVAASTAVAFCPDGHPANSGTSVEVTIGNDFTLIATGSANFVVATHTGLQCDIVDTTQVVNLAASATKVMQVSISETAGVVGATTPLIVKINLPLF